MENIIYKNEAYTFNESLSDSNIKQTLNYLAASKMRLGLLVNFREDSCKIQKSNFIISEIRVYGNIFIKK